MQKIIVNCSGDRLLAWAKKIMGSGENIPVLPFSETMQITEPVKVIFLAKPMPSEKELCFAEELHDKNSLEIITCDGFWLTEKQELERWLQIMRKRRETEAKRATQKKKTVLELPPRTICVEPTARCNLACPHCSSGRRESGREKNELDFKIVEKVLREADGAIGNLLMPFLGEALLLPELSFAIVKEAKKYHTIVDLATNGHFFTPKNIESILCSGVNSVTVTIDGLTQESYSHYRVNGRLDKVVDGLRELVQARKSSLRPAPHIRLQMIMMRHNSHEYDKFASFAESIGVDSYGLKTMHITDFATKDEWLPADPDKIRKRFKAEDKYEWQLSNNKNFFCDMAWTTLFLDAKGRALTCCFDECGDYVAGNLSENSLMEIWNSAVWQKLRSDLLQGIAVNPMCLELCQADF